MKLQPIHYHFIFPPRYYTQYPGAWWATNRRIAAGFNSASKQHTMDPSVYSWEFDGNFYKSFSDLSIEDLPSETGAFPITDMSVYPIEFASKEVVGALRKRGHMFWKCRARHYVSYNGKTDHAIQSSVSWRD